MPLRILIVRLSALGDTALTIPLFHELRRGLPGAYIGWAVGEGAAPIIEGLPGLDRMHVLRRRPSLGEFWEAVREIRSGRYDVSLDVQGLTKSAVLPFLARVPRRIGFARGRVEGRELSTFLSTELVRVPPGRTSIVARQLFLLESLALPSPERAEIVLRPEGSALECMRRWLGQTLLNGGTRPVIAFGIGAGWPTKVLPGERVASLVREARKRGWACIFVWGPAEREYISQMAAALGGEAVPAPPTSVKELVALLSLVDAYAGPDSAALHIAALLGKPTFSWFGASDPLRCAPEYYVPEKLAHLHRHIARDLPCRPCWKRSCRSCMCLEISENELVRAFLEWFEVVACARCQDP